jgi:hypothetical protein
MPYTVKLEHVPAGYAGRCAEEGEQCEVVYQEFTSTEDGQLFVSRLEGVPANILAKISGSPMTAASTTNNLFAIIRKDRTAKVYWNEFQPAVQVRGKGKIKAGDLVTVDHIMDIERVTVPSEALAPDVAICYVFSFGWRKGFFFDFGPAQTGKNHQPRDYDLEGRLAHCFSRVLFQHVFSIEQDTWAELFKQAWFPFSYLSVSTVTAMIKWAREQRSIDAILENISAEVQQAMAERIAEWREDETISPHLAFIKTAHERFVAEDYISASSILYPRLEGLIRTSQGAARPRKRLTQALLSKLGAGTHDKFIRDQSLLLPRQFEKYLSEVYFANFRPDALSDVVSRHSVAHGVVNAERLNRKATVIGFLILLQLFSIAKARGVRL